MEKNYRIDILKAKQKLFDSYPANSEARKLMIKKEQLNELNSLTVASHILYPDESVNLVLQEVNQKIANCFALGCAGIMLIIIMFGAKLLFPITSVFGSVCFYSIAGILGIGAGFYFYEAIRGIQAIRKTKKARKDLEDRIKELKNKIFGDL